MKNNRNGQAAILSNMEYSKIRNQIKSQKYKLLLDLAWYTGERWGALVKLQVEDVYNPDSSPREYINFRARSRKATPDGKRKTRQVPVHPILAESLLSYKIDTDLPWLFPNRAGDKPITSRWADAILRKAVDRAGLVVKGISTHSTRRTFITKLHRNGTDLYTIKQITGHQDFKSLERYVEIDSDRVKGAINAL
ncbi:site-specific integrase [Nostoc sp. CHAB 5715]|uniref:tyrosine-type recombinase/integrase n=1 Tax=Nostoc sp. CHAB 5715 TaxID=2780400 RepID=UPI001E2E24D4|nr:site-specific integrase [Nostoc sp. CHAB 5715]MCC5626464.1 site-specific integrase [Nostoc sp. CHAB 5715]